MMNTHKALSLHVSRFAQFGAWGMVLALLAACGSIPPPPSVPAFPAEEPNTKGIPSAAFTSFETGVKALEEKPANFIDAAKYRDKMFLISNYTKHSESCIDNKFINDDSLYKIDLMNNINKGFNNDSFYKIDESLIIFDKPNDDLISLLVQKNES